MPGEWTQPELARQFELLRSIISLSHKATEKARLKKEIRSSLEAEITIHTGSDAVRSTLMALAGPEASLSDYFIVSKLTLQHQEAADNSQDGAVFSETGTVEFCGERCTVDVVARSLLGGQDGCCKCPRCWKWVCPEEEGLCGRCSQVESNIK